MGLWPCSRVFWPSRHFYRVRVLCLQSNQSSVYWWLKRVGLPASRQRYRQLAARTLCSAARAKQCSVLDRGGGRGGVGEGTPHNSLAEGKLCCKQLFLIWVSSELQRAFCSKCVAKLKNLPNVLDWKRIFFFLNGSWNHFLCAKGSWLTFRLGLNESVKNMIFIFLISSSWSRYF